MFARTHTGARRRPEDRLSLPEHGLHSFITPFRAEHQGARHLRIWGVGVRRRTHLLFQHSPVPIAVQSGPCSLLLLCRRFYTQPRDENILASGALEVVAGDYGLRLMAVVFLSAEAHPGKVSLKHSKVYATCRGAPFLIHRSRTLGT